MSWSPTVAQVIWVAGPTMEALLLVQARRRKLWAVCPAFFWYIGLHIVRFAILFPLRPWPKPYFVAYWSFEAIDVFLVIAVLYSLFARLFSGYRGLWKLQDALFRWATAACILVAVVIAASVQGRESSRLLAGLLTFDLGAAVLQAGLVLFALVISAALALRWGRYAFAILIGLGVYNAVAVAAEVARLQFGRIASVPHQLIQPAAYACALLVWVVYFFGRERKHVPFAFVPQNDLAPWNEALVQLLTR